MYRCIDLRCAVWVCVNVACSVRSFEWSARLEKRYTSTVHLPFTIYRKWRNTSYCEMSAPISLLSQVRSWTQSITHQHRPSSIVRTLTVNRAALGSSRCCRRWCTSVTTGVSSQSPQQHLCIQLLIKFFLLKQHFLQGSAFQHVNITGCSLHGSEPQPRPVAPRTSSPQTCSSSHIYIRI